MKIKIAFFFFLLFKTFSIAQLSNNQVVPLIKNFSKDDLNIASKIFDISQSSNGKLYFATKGTLLSFDGFNWQNYLNDTENETDLRDVLYLNENEIYTSGHGGFGVWSTNELGGLNFKSLFSKIPTKKSPLLPVFKNIIHRKDKIYFQSFQQIYVYNKKQNTIEIIFATKGFMEMFSFEDRIFIQEDTLGLFEITYENEKKIVEGTKDITFEVVNLFRTKESILLVTKNNGFFNLENGVLKKNNWKINKLFSQYYITDIKRYDQDNFILGTLRNGFFIISIDGILKNHIDKSNGLKNNTVRKLFVDNNNNIWAATESGVSYIEYNSNLKFILDNNSEFGSTYTSLLKDSILYIGTNQGLFKKNININKSKLTLIENGQEQIWEIFENDDKILVGTHRGVFELKNNTLKTIHIEGGAWTFKLHPIYKDLLYVGFYSGIAVFKKVNNEWVFLKKFNNYGESSRFLEFDENNQIWVSHPLKGYYRIELSEDGLNIIEVDFYGVSNPAVKTSAYFTKIDKNLVFYNPKGFFFYNAIDNKFSKATYPTNLFKDINNINYIKQDKNTFWYTTDKTMGYIRRSNDDFFRVESPFYTLWDKHLKDFNKFRKLDSSIYSLNMEDGIAFYDFKINTKSKVQKPIVNSIQAISAKDTINQILNSTKKIKIPFKNNYIKVKVALPNIPYGKSKEIQYQLIGLKDSWSNLDQESELNFTGLKSGDYVLKIRANIDLNNFSESVSIPFVIQKPWYLSNLAKLIYVLSLILTFYAYNLYLKKKNLNYIQNLKNIEEQKRKKQKDRYELEKLVSDRELLLLKEKNLKLEIKKKNFALASSTLNNIKKNELLTDLINDIKTIDSDILNASLHTKVRKVLKKINNHLIDKEDWLTFQLHFNNSHSQFFQNLREKHPNLSSNETKLSAYLKLNLSSKEIASLMNVAVSSVEQSRYRLRKKFNLNKDENLVTYIQKI